MFLCNHPGSVFFLILLISHNTSQKTVRRRDSTAPEMAGREVRWKVKLAGTQSLLVTWLAELRGQDGSNGRPLRDQPLRLAATPRHAPSRCYWNEAQELG